MRGAWAFRIAAVTGVGALAGLTAHGGPALLVSSRVGVVALLGAALVTLAIAAALVTASAATGRARAIRRPAPVPVVFSEWESMPFAVLTSVLLASQAAAHLALAVAGLDTVTTQTGAIALHVAIAMVAASVITAVERGLGRLLATVDELVARLLERLAERTPDPVALELFPVSRRPQGMLRGRSAARSSPDRDLGAGTAGAEPEEHAITWISARGIRTAAVALGIGLATLAGAQAAYAHAMLVSSSPEDDAVLQRSPSRVVLRFSESVETPFGALRVLDSRGQRVDSGDVERPSGDTVAVAIDHTLADGTYTVAWSVISADTHPVHGAVVFSVGKPSANPNKVAASVLAGQHTPAGVSAAFSAVRILNIGLILLCAGGSLIGAFVIRGGVRDIRSRLAGVLAVLAGLLIVAALLGLPLEAAEAGSFGFVDALHGDVLRSVLNTGFGQAWASRAVIAAVVMVASIAYARRGRRPATFAGTVAVAGSALLAVTITRGGHAAAEGALTQAVDLVHVGAAAVWTGGLAALAVALRMTRGDGRHRGDAWVPVFSTIAVVAVAALIAAGVVRSYQELGELRGLWETTYGRLILGKVACVLVLLGFGLFHNRRIAAPLRKGTATDRERQLFARTIKVELAVMAVVVGLTGVLVGEPPAKAEMMETGPYSTTTTIGPYELDATVDPAMAGHNAIHLYLLDADGQPASVDEMQVFASLPKQNLGPLDLAPQVAGPGHEIVPMADLAIPGDWSLRIEVRRGKFDQWQQTIDVPIR